MKRFLDDNPRLAAAGAAGLVLFLAMFGRAFMGSVRPEPLSRNELTRMALEFAAAEGWESPNRVALTYPVEGDDDDAVRATAAAAGVAAPDRETLPDPAWETFVVANPRSVVSSITTFTLPDPILLIALTPQGRVVQYIEATSPIAGGPISEGTQNREPPFHELNTEGIFDTLDEDRLPVTDEDRERALAAARGFFARHDVAVPDAPKSLVVREGRSSSRLAYLTWEAPGPAGALDTTRVVVWNDRVAAYDHDVRPPGGPAPASKPSVAAQILTSVPALLIFFGSALIAVLVIIRRRQGELDLRSAATVFALSIGLTVAFMAIWLGLMAGLVTGLAGRLEVWFPIGSVLVTVPIASVLWCLVVAGAWATGEGQAYVVWPQHLVRPFSAYVRGHFRTPEAAAPVAAGYFAAFAALGAAAAIGLFVPRSPVASVSPLFALSSWPVSLAPSVQGLSLGLSLTVTAGVFAMTYTRLRTRRIWLVILVGSVVASSRPTFTTQQFFPGYPAAATAFGLALAVCFCVVFARYGPLASFTAVYAYVVMMASYPLLLTGNAGHAASGAWSMLLGLAPAAVAAYGVLRPREQRTATVPAHVRRALDRLRISEEFEVARLVQARLLPASAPFVAGLDVAGVCVPANEVGGDYFDYFKLADDRLGVAIGDVSGKGVGAAIYMTLTKSYMVTQSSREAEPVGVLSRVNEHLRRNLARGTFVTMVYAVIDSGRRRVVYARAGHNPPLLIRAGGEGDFLNAPGIALGAAGRATFEATTHVESVDLQPGDLVVLYTDGVTEAMDLRSDEYGEERMIAKLRQLAASPATAADTVDGLLKDVRAFAGRAPQHDDITIVAVRVH